MNHMNFQMNHLRTIFVKIYNCFLLRINEIFAQFLLYNYENLISFNEVSLLIGLIYFIIHNFRDLEIYLINIFSLK